MLNGFQSYHFVMLFWMKDMQSETTKRRRQKQVSVCVIPVCKQPNKQPKNQKTKQRTNQPNATKTTNNQTTKQPKKTKTPNN